MAHRLIPTYNTYTLNSKEIKSLTAWYENHTCKDMTEVAIEHVNTGVGTVINVSCVTCNSEKTNITDYDCW